MPPGGLTDNQYALWKVHPDLQRMFPGVEAGLTFGSDKVTSYGSYQAWWSDMEKNHPEALGEFGGAPKPPESSAHAPIGVHMTIPIEKENPLSLQALEEIAELYSKLSLAIHKYIESLTKNDGNPQGSGGLVEKQPPNP